jgi:hypothetical protein
MQPEPIAETSSTDRTVFAVPAPCVEMTARRSARSASTEQATAGASDLLERPWVWARQAEFLEPGSLSARRGELPNNDGSMIKIDAIPERGPQ